MLEKIKALFPNFTIVESEIAGLPCFHGVILVQPKTEIVGKARVTYGNVFLFISSEMYKGTDKSFFYGMIAQKVHTIAYRKQIGYDVEQNKVFCHNKDVLLLATELKEQTDMSLYKI